MCAKPVSDPMLRRPGDPIVGGVPSTQPASYSETPKSRRLDTGSRRYDSGLLFVLRHLRIFNGFQAVRPFDQLWQFLALMAIFSLTLIKCSSPKTFTPASGIAAVTSMRDPDHSGAGCVVHSDRGEAINLCLE